MGERGDNPLDILVIAASSARRALLTATIAKSARLAQRPVTAISTITAERFQQTAPDVVLVDAETEAIASAAFRVLENSPRGTGTVVLIDNPDWAWVSHALGISVNAILSREVSADELHLAILAAEAGLILLHPTSAVGLIQEKLSRQRLPRTDTLAAPREDLTRREQQILRLLSEGLGNKEIAARLSISDHTVKFHISSILGKLGASSRTEAVSQGIRRGLIAI